MAHRRPAFRRHHCQPRRQIAVRRNLAAWFADLWNTLGYGLEDEYATFITANPGHRIRIVIDVLRLLSDSAAIEGRHFTLDGELTNVPVSTRYTAVHVKVNGKPQPRGRSFSG